MKILLVEDTKTQRLYARRILRQFTHEVLEAENGLEALDIPYDHHDVQLIVLDWIMPICSGLEFLIESRKQGFEQPVIMMTTVNEKERVVEAIRAGAVDYISKPFTAELLLEKVSKWICVAESA